MGGYDEVLYKGERHKEFHKIIMDKVKKELGKEYDKWVKDEYPVLNYWYDYNTDTAYIEPSGEDFDSDEIELDKALSKKLNKDLYDTLVPAKGDMNSALELFYHSETTKRIHFESKGETVVVMDW